MVIKDVVKFLFNFIQSMLEAKRNELAKLICLIEFRGAKFFDLGERFENESKFGVEAGNLMINLGVKLSYRFVEGMNLGNNTSNIVLEVLQGKRIYDFFIRRSCVQGRTLRLCILVITNIIILCFEEVGLSDGLVSVSLP